MLIRYLVGRGTMDDGMISTIHRKQTTLRSTVGESKNDREIEREGERGRKRRGQATEGEQRNNEQE